MKSTRLTAFLALVLLLPAAVHAQSIITTEEEIIVPGNFMSPYSAPGVVIIDRMSGQWRRGDVNAGAVTWSAAYQSGLNRVSEATVGFDRSTFVTSPNLAGDLVVAVSASDQRYSRIQPRFEADAIGRHPANPGITAVVAYGRGSGITLPLSQTLYPTEWKADFWLAYDGMGNATDPGGIYLHPDDVLNVQTTYAVTQRPLRHGRRVRFTTDAWRMAFLQDIPVSGADPASSRLTFYNSSGTLLSTMPDLPYGAGFSTDLMDSSTSPVFVLTDPGSSTVRWTKIDASPAATLPVPSTTFTTAGGGPVMASVPVSQGTARGVLLLESLKGRIELWQFTGTGFTNTQLLDPPAGSRYTGVLAPPGQSSLIALTGPAAGGSTTGWESFTVKPNGTYARNLTGTVPAVRTTSAAHVFYFSAEPFVDPAASLLQGQNVPEWTRQTGSLSSVNALTFDSPTSGLRTSVVRTLTPPAGASWLLPNQFREDASVFALTSSAVRPDSPSAVIHPSPGSYVFQTDTAIPPMEVTWTVRAGDIVYYQINGGPWTLWNRAAENPLEVAPVSVPLGTAPASVRITWHVQAPSGVRSRLQTSDYAFAPAAPLLAGSPGTDANANGLSDDWERYYGLTDPNADPDGDGLNNLTEQNAGSDPLIRCGEPLLLTLRYVHPGQVRLVLTRTLQTGETLEQSTDLKTWQPLSTGAGITELLQTISGQRRWYRLRYPE